MQAGSGYQVTWQFGTADQYTIWNVDGAGSYVPGHTITSGKTSAFEALETTFQQDLNGDGTTGISTTVIEAAGLTTLAQVADTFTLNGVTLKNSGTAVTDGQFGAWKPIGAEYGGPSSYRVVWQFGTADQYTVWNVDDLGNNHTTNPLIMLGKAYALEGLRRRSSRISMVTARQASSRR